jgi:hypothetical protein
MTGPPLYSPIIGGSPTVAPPCPTPCSSPILNPERPLPPAEKVVLSPPEFAALFGRHYTWAYRQIKAGRVKVVTETGRILIPRSEVDRILNQARHIS